MTTRTPCQSIGVLLMTYGSPETLDDVPAYLASVRHGRQAPPELVAEFQRRYRAIGGSPLLKLTLAQASALESTLNSKALDGERYRVAVGMLHAPPWISDALAQLGHEGVRRIVGVILSPQYSPIIMGGYNRAVEKASAALGPDADVRVAGAWHKLPAFLDALAQRVREALERLPTSERATIPVLFTAHSLPKSVVDREPEYIQQLKETASAVVERLGLPAGRWQFAYQSAGHTPEEWLKPDIKELFPRLREAGHRSALVVPIQFLADHLELLYDIDVAARAEAEAAGLHLVRAEAFNTMPQFINALAEVVRGVTFAEVTASPTRG